MSAEIAAPPFDDSRRLTGANLFFDGPGAVLDAGSAALDARVQAAWRASVERAQAELGWTGGAAAWPHAGGVTLAVAAPLDQLFTATEVNEWALWRALRDCANAAPPPPAAPGWPAAWDADSAAATLRALARAESSPRLRALAKAAAAHGLVMLGDDADASVGSGRGVRTWPLSALPDPAGLDWRPLGDVPIVLVTGSNGKTTTTRVLAALARAHGWRTAHTCTDGVYVDGGMIAAGDYSGPGGARLALRQVGIDAAILETARGGILRRGLAPTRADVAVVTNISDDHFGEYGIDDLDGLAEVKLTVARPLGSHGVLVVNGDDALLLRHARARSVTLALFGLDADSAVLAAHRDSGGASCGVRGGRLVLEHAGGAQDLGAIAAMPLTCAGEARYNVANLAAAALAAAALGIRADTIRAVYARFGAARGDNPGRLERFAPGGIEVIVDYAHNPGGLRGLLAIASRQRTHRLGLLLGQAGNRGDAEIRVLAGVAAAAHPDRVVLKDLPGYLRGRAEGEIPAILHAALLANGVAAADIATELDEWAAVRRLLAWARSGDVVVLPVHGKRNRPRVGALLQALVEGGWRAGDPVPDPPAETA